MTKEEIERLRELDQLHQEQYESETVWQEYDKLGDHAPKRKFPWLTAWIIIGSISLLVAIMLLPAVARRVHAPYVPAPTLPTTTELAQQICANHNQLFHSWMGRPGVYEVFCYTGDSVELTRRFMKAK